MWIIPSLDELEDRGARLVLGLEAFAVEQLTFKRGKKCFAQGVVETVAYRAHRRRRAGLLSKVSSPGELHPEALPERCVNLAIHTAPIIQPLSRSRASGRTYLERPSSSCATTDHRAAYSAPASCTCAEPIAQVCHQCSETSRASSADRTPHSSSTNPV